MLGHLSKHTGRFVRLGIERVVFEIAVVIVASPKPCLALHRCTWNSEWLRRKRDSTLDWILVMIFAFLETFGRLIDICYLFNVAAGPILPVVHVRIV